MFATIRSFVFRLSFYTTFWIPKAKMEAACSATSLAMNAGSMESLSITEFQDSSSIGEVLLQFCKESLHTDVIFNVQCGEKWVEFPAHKLVVCIWSPVLSDMLTKEEDRIVNAFAYQITDVLPTVFDAMIKFMYGSRDAVENMQKDTSFILKLMKAAISYRMEALRRLCWKIIIEVTSPNVDNLFHLLEAADLYDYPILRNRCLKVLQARTHHILQSRDLGSFTPAMIRTVLAQPRVSFESEFDLASWVFAWVKNRFLDKENLMDIRSIAMDVLPYLRLDTLTAEEFGRLLQGSSNIIHEEEGFAIFMNIVLPGSRPLPDWCQEAKKIKRVYQYDGLQ